MKKTINILLILFFLFLEFFLLFNSKEVINDFSKTLNICLYSLMPTMFFSILFSQILIKLNIENFIPSYIIKTISYIFNINENESSIFLLSILSGYPNNAKLLKNNDNLNNIINFTNFISPIFFIGTVGNIYLKNVKLCLLLLISHYLSNIILGILLRNKNHNKLYIVKNNTTSFFDIYFNSLKNTTITLINIFSNILFFSILISLINNILPNNIIKFLVIGLIEFSSGVYLICSLNINNFIKGLLILIIISFSSFSIHMQMININEKIKYVNFLFYKFVNIFISIIIYITLYNLILN